MLLKIRDLFELQDGTKVMACENSSNRTIDAGEVAELLLCGVTQMSVTIVGVRTMLGHTVKKNIIALDTRGDLKMTVADAQGGEWSLLLDD